MFFWPDDDRREVKSHFGETRKVDGFNVTSRPHPDNRNCVQATVKCKETGKKFHGISLHNNHYGRIAAEKEAVKKLKNHQKKMEK